ncbi:MAG: DUF2892 domain-containing protein, partial [Nitrosomonadales bacterium]|nr:DUF2892 domain-containing protein [Nitrosomonadales bacterium]
MNAERIVRIVAGSFILLSLSLGVEASPLFVSNKFLWFTAFVGLNLFQSGFGIFDNGLFAERQLADGRLGIVPRLGIGAEFDAP